MSLRQIRGGSYAPLKKALIDVQEAEKHPLWNGEICVGRMRLSSGRDLKVALACVGEMGMAPTAAVATRAISLFRPRLIAMLGMCCGFNNEKCSSGRKLLDVIVARSVSCWEEGKYVDPSKGIDFQNRAKPRAVDDVIRDEVEQIIERKQERLISDLQKLCRTQVIKSARSQIDSSKINSTPDVKYGLIVTGSSVIASKSMVENIIDRHPLALGLDMEIYGLYTAADQAFGRKPSVLAIKGVADFGDGDKNDVAQVAASVISGKVFRSIINELSIFK